MLALQVRGHKNRVLPCDLWSTWDIHIADGPCDAQVVPKWGSHGANIKGANPWILFKLSARTNLGLEASPQHLCPDKHRLPSTAPRATETGDTAQQGFGRSRAKGGGEKSTQGSCKYKG